VGFNHFFLRWLKGIAKPFNHGKRDDYLSVLVGFIEPHQLIGDAPNEVSTVFALFRGFGMGYDIGFVKIAAKIYYFSSS